MNLGQNLDDDSLPVATNVLVFLLVPLNAHWKVPVAYYLMALNAFYLHPSESSQKNCHGQLPHV